MPEIVIVGGGGHAKVLISILKKSNHFNIVGYTDVQDRGLIIGIPYLGPDEILLEYKKTHPDLCAALGIGLTSISDKREKIFNRLQNLKIDCPTIVSPQAIVNEDVEIDEGSVVFDGVVINSGSRIGKGVILNTSCTVEHDCLIDDYTHIAPGVTLSGGVQIGKNSMIGVGATIIQGVKITNNVMIGAGSVVIKDILKAGKYAGVPVRELVK